LRDVIVKYNEVLLAQIQQGSACNAFHEAEARLCRWLLQTRDRIDSDTIPLTQEFLAQMLGVRRTTVTLIARALQKRGHVRYRRGKIEIVDRAGLERCAASAMAPCGSRSKSISRSPTLKRSDRTCWPACRRHR
jgi:hypothetical protein